MEKVQSYVVVATRPWSGPRRMTGTAPSSPSTRARSGEVSW